MIEMATPSDDRSLYYTYTYDNHRGPLKNYPWENKKRVDSNLKITKPVYSKEVHNHRRDVFHVIFLALPCIVERKIGFFFFLKLSKL